MVDYPEKDSHQTFILPPKPDGSPARKELIRKIERIRKKFESTLPENVKTIRPPKR